MLILFVKGSFGIAISLVSDGQERLDLTSVEKRCNTTINTLPGEKVNIYTQI